MIEQSAIQSYVTEKFKTSQYILNRKIGDASSVKYYPEEIRYWVNKIYQSNWDESLFNAEFEAIYKVSHDNSLSSLKNNDYIGQTFYIDKIVHPYGIYLNDVEIFTAQEDKKATITLDLRKLVNGVPSNVPIEGSIVTLRPDDTRTDPEAFVPWSDPYTGLPKTTTESVRDFEFVTPVYLEPGYYCFTLTTNSSKYSVYTTQNGMEPLGVDRGKAVVNPYIGDYIYSGQGESWVVDPTKDLCFILWKSYFEVGTESVNLTLNNNTYYNPTKVDPSIAQVDEKDKFDFDLFEIIQQKKVEIPNVAYISDSYVTFSEAQTNNEKVLPIVEGRSIIPESHSTLDNGFTLTLELTNKHRDVTPLIAPKSIGAAFVRNYIDPYSQSISDSELTPHKGLAFAKYVTKPVLLNEGFDADGITVYVDVEKPYGSSIEVFYRVLNRYDFSVEFDDSNWYRLPKKSTDAPTQLSGDYSEETYELLNLSYIGKNGETYTTFNRIAAKVVFYSDDPTKIPSIKNLRVIATV